MERDFFREQDLAYQAEMKERYWDAYLTYCHAEGTIPSYKDFIVWYEETHESV